MVPFDKISKIVTRNCFIISAQSNPTTTAYQMPSLNPDSASECGFPPRIDLHKFDSIEKLKREEAGHLRHFHNLATQVDGQWAHMGTQYSAQEWVDGYRYQLATMAYAAGAAHYFRLPALRSCFKQLLQDLISKMLRPEVWGYWFNSSHSGKLVDPDIKELRQPWADPIVRENIMVRHAPISTMNNSMTMAVFRTSASYGVAIHDAVQ